MIGKTTGFLGKHHDLQFFTSSYHIKLKSFGRNRVIPSVLLATRDRECVFDDKFLSFGDF
jgi:hypothetical protein